MADHLPAAELQKKITQQSSRQTYTKAPLPLILAVLRQQKKLLQFSTGN